MMQQIDLEYHNEHISVVIMRDAAKEYVKKHGPAESIKRAEQYLTDNNEFKRMVGLYLIFFTYPQSAQLFHSKIFTVTDDSSWKVREVVATAMRRFLEKDFNRWFPVLEQLSVSGKVNCARAAIVASMIKKLNEQQVTKVLNMYVPHLKSNHVYIKKNLGPFALAHCAMKQPDITFEFMKAMSQNADSHVRWNVLMAFSQRMGKAYPQQAAEFMKLLEADKSVVVQRAVASLRKKLR